MSLYVSYPQQSLKRARYDNDAVHNLSQKFARIDQLTVQEARKVFLESNSIDFQNAIELETKGSLKNIHGIHERIKAVCDSGQRKDRSVLRIIKRLPDVLSVNNLLSSSQLEALQKHLWDRSYTERPFFENRYILDYPRATVSIETSGTFNIDYEPNGNRSDAINRIYQLLFQKSLEAAYKIDGEDSVGSYTAKFTIARAVSEIDENEPLLKLLHHDRKNDQKPFVFPKYVFLAMLSDKDGKNGWKGGDLIIQNNSSLQKLIPLDNNQTHLQYEYKINEGILLKNKKMIHQVTIIKQKDEAIEIARDLLQIRLFENRELDPFH